MSTFEEIISVSIRLDLSPIWGDYFTDFHTFTNMEMQVLVNGKPKNSYGVLSQLGGRCEWLRDDKFLKDLEGDSVDTEILDEELRSLQDDELPKTCRGRTVRFLESNPFNIVLCFLVLVDAGVVIAEILLDLHAIRGQYEETRGELMQVLDFVKLEHGDALGDYLGDDVQYILDMLGKRAMNYSESEERTKRHIISKQEIRELLQAGIVPNMYEFVEYDINEALESSSEDSELFDVADYPETTLRLLKDNWRLRSDISQLQQEINEIQEREEQGKSPEKVDLDRLQKQLDEIQEREEGNRHQMSPQRMRRASEGDSEADPQSALDTNVKDSGKGKEMEEPNGSDHIVDENNNNDHYNKSDDYWRHYGNNSHGGYPVHKKEYKPGYKKKYSKADKLLKIAHILHYCSIAILGVFVVQLLLKIYGLGFEFFRRKMEIFDGVIILASFGLDLVFLDGIGAAQGEEAAALLIIFLLWRILRVVNGIMITAKKRQEFRIKLQKRARRRGEKKVELLEEDKQWREKEMAALKELARELGATDEEIIACRPRKKSVLHRMGASMGLTSVASLSLSLSMSMSGGAFDNTPKNHPVNQIRRESLAALNSPARPSRRASLFPESLSPGKPRRASLAPSDLIPAFMKRDKSPSRAIHTERSALKIDRSPRTPRARVRMIADKPSNMSSVAEIEEKPSDENASPKVGKIVTFCTENETESETSSLDPTSTMVKYEVPKDNEIETEALICGPVVTPNGPVSNQENSVKKRSPPIDGGRDGPAANTTSTLEYTLVNHSEKGEITRL